MKPIYHITQKFKQSGMSLVELVVAVGISGTMALGVGTMLVNNQKETIALKEKLGMLGIESDLLSYSSNDICNREFNHNVDKDTKYKRPTVMLADPKFVWPVDKLYTSTAPDSSLLIDSTAKQESTIGSSTHKVASIVLKNLKPVDANRYSADLVVSSNGGIRKYKDISSRVLLTTKVVGPDTILDGCAGYVGGNEQLASSGCPAGKYITGFDAQGAPICTLPPAPILRGETIGTCTRQIEENGKVDTGPSKDPTLARGMIKCPDAGAPTCPDGSTLVKEIPIQMNCSANHADWKPCYWQSFNCVRNQGSEDLTQFVQGHAYGSCIQKWDPGYNSIGAEKSWPVLACGPKAGNVTCEDGFSPGLVAVSQFNCAANPSMKNIERCHWVKYQCIKN